MGLGDAEFINVHTKMIERERRKELILKSEVSKAELFSS